MNTALPIGLSVLLSWLPATAAAALTKASDWLGYTVTTRDGEQLGTVRDIAIDDDTGKIVYLVVSVGSFLIENNLIAIAPDALAPSTKDGTLTLDAEPSLLPKARRFAHDSQWPAAADVTRDAKSDRPLAAAPNTSESTEAPRPQGTATIESRSRTAHLSANERYIKETVPPAPPVPPVATGKTARSNPAPALDTPFDRLDRDRDGVLNRAEFAHQLSRHDSYSKVDANANGVIDRDEFEAFRAATSEKAE